MANEAVLRDRIGEPIDFIVADGTGIEKGAICSLQDPRTASTCAIAGDKIAGIAAREKVASDGRTHLAMWRTGIFDMLTSGTVELGDPVAAFSENSIGSIGTVGAAAAKANLSGASIIGYALETGADNETIQVLVDVGHGIQGV